MVDLPYTQVPRVRRRMIPKAREMARTVVFLIVQVNSNVALSECTTPSETVMVSIRGLGWFMSDTIYGVTLSHKLKIQ